MISIVVVFPAPFGPEQSKTLALFHGQIEPAHRLHRRLAVVALHELCTTNGEHW